LVTRGTSLIIRADASTKIGTGHIMRCMALAQAWQSQGSDAAFISHCESDSLRHRIESAGIGFRPLEQPHPHPSDLQTTLQLLERLASHQPERLWLVLDGYHFGPAYQQEVRAAGYRLLTVDDMAHLPYYHADVVLNQNITAEQLAYPCGPETLLLLGARYALLRPEFLKWQDCHWEIPEVARKVLVTLGGSDPDNVTLKVIRGLREAKVEGLETKVVVGPQNPHLLELQRAVRDCPAPIHLMHSSQDMAGLMAWADVAISGAGSTCWELAYMGLPAVLLVLAENQRSGAEGLHQAGAAVNLGWHQQVKVSEITDELTVLCHDYRRRQELSYNSQRLIDGKGAQRVLNVLALLDGSELDQDSFKIRLAAPGDAAQMWRLANDPVVRQNSFNQEPIPWESHIAWYHQKLTYPDSRIWVLDVGGLVVAQARYDRDGPGSAVIDFSVAPAFRGKGLGTMILTTTCQDACRQLGIKSVRGIVFKDNVPSAHAFAKAGFICTDEVQQQGQSCYAFEFRCS
jgi:UDP-2,4-diacetamido-2,4,6-trideoxy-beta-L-altropyranose hydrolase